MPYNSNPQLPAKGWRPFCTWPSTIWYWTVDHLLLGGGAIDTGPWSIWYQTVEIQYRKWTIRWLTITYGTFSYRTISDRDTHNELFSFFFFFFFLSRSCLLCFIMRVTHRSVAQNVVEGYHISYIKKTNF